MGRPTLRRKADRNRSQCWTEEKEASALQEAGRLLEAAKSLEALCVVFHDQLNFNWEENVLRTWKVLYSSTSFTIVELHPIRSLIDSGKRFDNDVEVLAFRSEANDVSWADSEGRNVHLSSVHQNVTVTDQLTCLRDRRSESSAKYNVVCSSLKKLDQLITGRQYALFLALFKQSSKLFFTESVIQLELLLFTQLKCVVRELPTSGLSVHTRWVRTVFD